MKLIFFSLMVALVAGCATTYPNRKPIDQPFPSVEGTALTGKKWKIPEGMRGKPTLLLLGYEQDTQFDIDRWLIGLDMTRTQVPAYEIPTIQGLFPRMFSTKIDEGMRSGIPKDLWKGVITVYSDGAKLQEFTGNENALNARVLLIDSDGVIRFFHDRGFSVGKLNELRAKLKELGASSPKKELKK